MRQGKAESAGDNMYKLTAPNQGEAFIAIRRNDAGKWIAALRTSADGSDLAVTDKGCDTTSDAWYAAFELYRRALVV
jgi:hypothetical protein